MVNEETTSDFDEEGRQYLSDTITEVLDFSSYDLRTTIRLIVLSGEGRRVDVKRGSKKGSVFIDQGEIRSVFTSEKQGDEAFFDILSWDGAIHTDMREIEPPAGNVNVPTNVLLDLLKKGGLRS